MPEYPSTPSIPVTPAALNFRQDSQVQRANGLSPVLGEWGVWTKGTWGK
jgi:hypothetical protein